MYGLSSWLADQIGSIPSAALPLLALTLLITAVGFYRRVYFVSIGYGFSIAAMALASLAIFRGNVQALTLIQVVLLMLYGLRLGGFLLRREMTQAAYRRQLEEVHEGSRSSRGLRDIGIWLGVSVLYVIMFSPCLFMLATPAQTFPGWAPVAQGVGLASMPAYTTPTRLVVSLVGLACIVLIMMGSTKRLERSQDERYGELADYQRYARTVPVLFPFVPIYSLKNLRVYLE